ncbi:MAG: hypothetical protein QOH06_2760 [Acidobacteriota bacterium]|jgi:hypothetical protein|nr:hypothetical protein [Acidobacteriota bacterium]
MKDHLETSISASAKGRDFELKVKALLDNLVAKFPHVVTVGMQVADNNAPRPYRPDFELEYHLGGLRHRHLIECQDRDSYSYDLADKIYTIRGTTERNRYIFIYKNRAFRGTPQERRLHEMGVLTFDLTGFHKFITQLKADLALRQLGLLALGDQFVLQGGASLTELRRMAFKNNPKLDSPADQAMLSTPTTPAWQKRVTPFVLYVFDIEAIRENKGDGYDSHSSANYARDVIVSHLGVLIFCGLGASGEISSSRNARILINSSDWSPGFEFLAPGTREKFKSGTGPFEAFYVVGIGGLGHGLTIAAHKEIVLVGVAGYSGLVQFDLHDMGEVAVIADALGLTMNRMQ